MNIPAPAELRAALLDVVRVAVSELESLATESKIEIAKLEAPIDSYIKRLEAIADANALASIVQRETAELSAETAGVRAYPSDAANALRGLLQTRGVLP